MINIDVSGKYVTIECQTAAEIAAVANACRVISRGHSMQAKVNKAELQHLREIQARFNRPAPAKATAALRERVVIGVPASGLPTAPDQIARNGKTLRLAGYGKTWRINSDDFYAVHGISPEFDYACYAYYAE